MKLNLKVIAAAVALLAAGSANAAFEPSGQPSGSSLVLVAFNAVTKSYYVRNTGFVLNDFLPSSVTTGSGDGGLTGNKTPEAGLLLDKNNTTSFADAAFGSWLGSQTLSDIRWTAFASDSQSSSGTANVSRLLLAVNGTPSSVNNGTVTNAASVVDGFAIPLGSSLSTTGPTVFAPIEGNLVVQPATLGLLDQASSLYYYSRSQGTLANSTAAIRTQYGNSLYNAFVTLESDGDFIYSLQAADVGAVPVPAAAWLFGTGLVGLGGAIRRRKAAAKA